MAEFKKVKVYKVNGRAMYSGINYPVALSFWVTAKDFEEASEYAKAAMKEQTYPYGGKSLGDKTPEEVWIEGITLQSNHVMMKEEYEDLTQRKGSKDF